MPEKKVSDSASHISRVMMPTDANIAGNVFGGTILKMVDEVSGLVALRHCNSNVVTASIEHMDFLYPVHVGDLLSLDAKLTYVGNSSMEVFVSVTAENLMTGERQHAGDSIVTLVSLDRDGHPKPAPRLILTTDEERRLYAEGEKRRNLRIERAKERKKTG
ncbi:MAG: acyl-CoA thioesterase [Thermoplasmata archaeon]|uniref:Acyl-CoA thioesterase n=1 Tax=Candidatus Sysuiplasma superficiale TaxID=2823368 RepID=A0A8J8CDC0_9ARCH|nr:acyl-CoA thioesterase [Candidatus Sysuiplasma superficiale]MBX8643204.1 acyl-CoA thioesterase [Candidatus Sysuiplasma superficiale]MCL4346711.1 acyl-CoA thioesterase [Candidatus Thermoplasmatota archaeon]MCL5437352.1 acyl-CoA thioesterase [Candidatus Thermoplasmatota archaeon]